MNRTRALALAVSFAAAGVTVGWVASTDDPEVGSACVEVDAVKFDQNNGWDPTFRLGGDRDRTAALLDENDDVVIEARVSCPEFPSSTTTTTEAPATTTTEAPTTTTTAPPTTTTTAPPPPPDDGHVFFCDFAEFCELDQGVQYRDRHLVHSETYVSEHAATGLIECGPPETTRTLSRYEPFSHTYYCQPGGNPDLGHQMSVATDSSGYTFVYSSPPEVFTDLSHVSFEVNQTSVHGRAFWEVAVIPAENAWVDAMPCIPNLPCNDGFDYDTLNAYGFGNTDQYGSGFAAATPTDPDGAAHRWSADVRFQPDRAPTVLENGDLLYSPCPADGHCFRANVHTDTTSVRDRFDVVVEERADGIWFGQEETDGVMHWVRLDGEFFPDGPVRVVLKFHTYTPNKSYDNWPTGCTESTTFCNDSSSVDAFTFHWDDFRVEAGDAVSTEGYYIEPDEDRFVSHLYPGCIAFAEGIRGSNRNGNSGVDPIISCPEGLAELVNGSNVRFGDYRNG